MREVRSAERVVQAADRGEERRDVPRLRWSRAEDGDLPVHREGDLARGRLLLRLRTAPFAVRMSVTHCPAVAGLSTPAESPQEGGRSEVKRSRAGSSHGEPRTEPRPPRRRSRRDCSLDTLPYL